MYALRFDKTGFKDQCHKKEFEKSIDKSLIEKLIKESTDKGVIEKLIHKFKFIIDLQKFQNMCYETNSI